MSARAIAVALLAGLLAGFAVGLYYAWNVNPIQPAGASPRSLAAAQRDEYLVVIAGSFAVDRDLARAQTRLAAAGEGRDVAALADRGLRAGWSAARLCPLVALAQALGHATAAVRVCPGMVAPSPTPAPSATPSPTARATGTRPPTPTATPTRRPTATATRPPTATPTATPRYLYRVAARQQLCNPGQQEPRIEVLVQDAEGEGLPGVEVRVSWPGGEDRFYTGLKPDIDPGYADYDPRPDTTYTVDLPGSPSAAGSPPVGDLAPFTCGGGATQGVWRVVFERLEP
jgi:hypothetical protein